MPAWAYREQMTVALVSSAELTVLLPYITPPIVLFSQLFGEKSEVCTLKVNSFMSSGVRGREGAHRSHMKETAQASSQNIDNHVSL